MSDDTQPYTWEEVQDLKKRLAERDSRAKVEERLREYRLNEGKRTSKPDNASDIRNDYFARVRAGTEAR